MTNLTLSIQERIYFPRLFSSNKDSLTEATVQRSIIQQVKIGDEERESIDLKQNGDRITWDPTKGLDKDFSLTPEHLIYLKHSIYNLSKAGGITQALLPICEKLI
jgi:hypothetical protein